MAMDILCYNKNGELVAANTFQKLEEGDILEIKGQDSDYIVAEASVGNAVFGGHNTLVSLEKYRQQKQEKAC